MQELLGVVNGSVSGIKADAMTVIVGCVGLILLVLGIHAIGLAVRTIIGGINNDN